MIQDIITTAAVLLREKALKLVKPKQSKPRSKSFRGNTLKLIHELEVHQNILEQQNEENNIREVALSHHNKDLVFQMKASEKRFRELSLFKDEAIKRDKLKSSLLANMSHEIKTPMNGIMGFTDLLKDPDLSPDRRVAYLGLIEKSGAHMLKIINDMLEISKVEMGMKEAFISACNINEQVEYIYDFFLPEVEKKGMQISFNNYLPTEEAIVNTDSEKIYAVLTNLVKNAIKYSDEGKIEIGYTINQINQVSQTFKPYIGAYNSIRSKQYETDSGLDESAANASTLTFFVKDTGIGIPHHKQHDIFDRFIQVDSSDKRAFDGVGLGLAISKAYVELLGGRIWVVSGPGTGSTFYFTIPYMCQPAETVFDLTNDEEDNLKNEDYKRPNLGSFC